MWHRSVPAEFPGQAVPDPGEVIYQGGVLPGHAAIAGSGQYIAGYSMIMSWWEPDVRYRI